jgi:hypothetical protein
VSVACGIDPAALLDLDPDMFEALERRAAPRWSGNWLVQDELAALLVDTLNAFWLAWLQAHGAKRLPVWQPVIRPDRDGFPRPPVLTASQFAAEWGPRG